MQKNMAQTLTLMGNEICNTNLIEKGPELQIPLYLGLGRFDNNLPPETAIHFFEQLIATKKELVWFEKSAHVVTCDEPDKVKELLIQTVLPEIKKDPQLKDK